MSLVFSASRLKPIKQQLSSRPAPSDELNANAKLVTVCHVGKQYVLDSAIAKKGARGRYS